MPPRRRVPPRSRPRLPPGDRERRLAEEVLYLHSLWRRGPPAPAPIQSRSARRESSKRKRQRLDSAAAAAEPQDTGAEWPIAPSPPNPSPKTWPEAAPASSPAPAKPLPPPASPGALVQQEALRAAADFFSNRGSSPSDDEDDVDGSESEGEQDAAGFITGLFERDAALRSHYERGWEEGQFACMACAGGTRKAGRRFRGCVALVQHAHSSTRYGRPRAHRALAAVVCRVLGWDIKRLPSIVIDPRGTLGQAIAAEATAYVQLAKEGIETGIEDSSTDGDEVANELECSEEYDEEVLESMEESDEEEDVETGMEDSSADSDEEANELASSDESAEKFNADNDDSLFQDNSGEVHKQEIAKEYAEQENTNNLSLTRSKDTCKNEEHCKEAAVQEDSNPKSSGKEDAKTSVDTGDTDVTRLGNNSSMEENAGENKGEHAEKTS